MLVLSGLMLLPKLLKLTINIDKLQVEQHGGKTRAEILSAKNMELEHDNKMNNRTIIELTQEIETLKSQLALTRPRKISNHVYERVFKTRTKVVEMTKNPMQGTFHNDGNALKFTLNKQNTELEHGKHMNNRTNIELSQKIDTNNSMAMTENPTETI